MNCQPDIFPSAVSQRALQERGGQFFLAFLRWPKMSGSNRIGTEWVSHGTADQIPDRWITILGWRLIFVLALVVWQGQLWKMPFFLVTSADKKKKNPGFPFGLGFGHLQDDWTAPGVCQPSGTVVCSARPLFPRVWRVVILVVLLCALVMAHSVTNPCRETEICVTSLCK